MRKMASGYFKKKICILLISVVIVLVFFAAERVTAQVVFSAGIETGYGLSFYDASGASFGLKSQQGLGANYFIEALIGDYFAVELEAGGLNYQLKSDDTGSYYYPERIEIPLGIKFKGVIPFNGGDLFGAVGYAFPYILQASYYFPRTIYSALSVEIGSDFTLPGTKWSIGPVVRFSYFLDATSDAFFTVNILVRLTYTGL